ncbi:MAG: hypothetical protein JWQ43_1246 [Glaciihabitans sp.]|nr:hypothetical protein [Glaciihabitans sp.]
MKSTSHSRRSAQGAQSGRRRFEPTVSDTRKRRRIVVLAVVGVLALCAIWFGTRLFVAATSLRSAQHQVAQLQQEAADFDLAAAAATGEELRGSTESAASAANDPIWRIAELVPVLGRNLTAVRAVADSANSIVTEVASPAIRVVANFDLSERDPATGGFNLAPLKRAESIASSAPTVFANALAPLEDVNTDGLVTPVAEAIDTLTTALRSAEPVVDDAAPLVNLVGGALGDKGPRNYLLAFQNNAESTALGGSAASYTMLHADTGVVTIKAQANSGDFLEGIPLDIAIDASAADLYGTFLTDHINTSTSRPDFPTAARIISAFWQRDPGPVIAPGDSINGVLSIDPLALAMMLRATGPITLTSGDELTTDNAVALLTNEVYFRYPTYSVADKDAADAFFSEASSAIVAKLMGGDFDVPTMVGAIGEAVDQGSILAWSADEAEQAALDGTRIQGVLPTSNTDETVIGVYYRDTSASKIDSYLRTSTVTTSDICSAPGSPSFTTAVTLTSTLTPELAAALPPYLAPRDWGPEKFRTEVFVYGPVGASVTDRSVTVEGLQTDITASVDDLGRPVASFGVYLAPGETSTVQVSFQGAVGDYGPLEVRGTPMINTTQASIDPVAVCG